VSIPDPGPPPEGGPAFSLQGLAKRFGATVALQDVGLTVDRGEIHALVGGNGSGKSTLIKILAGVVQADAGLLDAGAGPVELAGHTPREAHAAGFRFVHQDLGIFEELTIVENLGLGGEFGAAGLGPINWRRQTVRARSVLDRFGLPARPRDQAGSLSVPQRTILAIARALADDAEGSRVLVLDEPTAALAPHEADLVLDTARRLAGEGVGVLLVTHRLDEVRAAADRVTGLRDGRNSGTVAAEELDEQGLVRLILGRRLEIVEEPPSAPAAGPVPRLRIEGLGGGPVAPVSLEVGAGEVVGIAGLQGSGRSELLRLIFGADRRSAGSVSVDGRAVGASPRSACAAGIGMVPENRATEGIFPTESVRMNLTEGDSRRYFRRGRLRAGEERSAAEADLHDYGIKAGSIDIPIEMLSGGNQQKAVLARWLRRRAKVLLLDEPTQGVDVGGREEIYRLVGQAAAEGSAIVVVSSEYEELARLCHRVITLVEGVAVSEMSQPLSAHELLRETLVRAELNS
jgi:ribose transport system ATP-binding protein